MSVHTYFLKPWNPRTDPGSIALFRDSRDEYRNAKQALRLARLSFEYAKKYAAEGYRDSADGEVQLAISYLVSALWFRARARHLRDGALGLPFVGMDRGPWD